MKTGTLRFGTETFINKATGEEVEVPTVYQDATDSGFEKIWLGHILTSLNELGNKKIQILSYLFQKKINPHNIVTKTLQEIAKETGISYPTVSETIHILAKAGLIKRKTGIIYLSPSMIFKGKHDTRMRIMFEYRNVGAGKEATVKELPPAPETEPDKEGV
jgi:DNA-binding transcriptional ArsR family regulator